MSDAVWSDDNVVVIETLRISDILVLAVAGEVDMATSPGMRHRIAALLDGEVRHLVLDFSGVGFCDSSGLNVLLDVWRALQDRHGGLSVSSAPPIVGRALSVTGLDRSIGQYPDVSTALTSLNCDASSPATDI